MDSVKLNKDGVAPIKAELDQLAALKDKKELYALLGDMQKKGIIVYNVLYVGADEMNSSMNAVQTYQTGLSMGEREYYLENDEATAKIRDAFRTHTEDVPVGWFRRGYCQERYGGGDGCGNTSCQGFPLSYGVA